MAFRACKPKMVGSSYQDIQCTLSPDSSSQMSHSGPRSHPDASPEQGTWLTTKSFQQPWPVAPPHPPARTPEPSLNKLPCRQEERDVIYKQGNLHKNSGGVLSRNLLSQKRMRWHIQNIVQRKIPFSQKYYTGKAVFQKWRRDKDFLKQMLREFILKLPIRSAKGSSLHGNK